MDKARDTSIRAEAERLKRTISIAAVIGEKLPLRRVGRQFIAVCPFHTEKAPSFCVYPDHYYCFGCGAYGDIFAWLMKTRGLTFLNAVEQLRVARLPTVSSRSAAEQSRDAVASRHQELARRIWLESTEPRGTRPSRFITAFPRRQVARRPGDPISLSVPAHRRCTAGDGGQNGGSRDRCAMWNSSDVPVARRDRKGAGGKAKDDAGGGGRSPPGRSARRWLRLGRRY